MTTKQIKEIKDLDELDKLVKTHMNPEMKLSRDMQDIIKTKVSVFNDTILNDIITQYIIPQNKKTKFINRYEIVSKDYRKSIKSKPKSENTTNNVPIKSKSIIISVPEINPENTKEEFKERSVKKEIVDETEIITIVDTIIKTTIIKKPKSEQSNDTNYVFSEFCREKLMSQMRGASNLSYIYLVFRNWYEGMEEYKTVVVPTDVMFAEYLTNLGYKIVGGAVYNVAVKSSYSVSNNEFFDFKTYKEN